MRVGIVGCGRITNERHIPAWLRIKDVKIVAVCDRRENIAKETGTQFGIGEFYEDLSSMLETQNLDLVDICTPPRTHSSLSIEAMNAGCHVLVEKPMAISVKEADEMITASRKNDVKLCVVHQLLFNPVVRKAKSLIDRGVIGDLIDVNATFLERNDSLIANQDHWCHNLPLGIFGECAPHAVYFNLAFIRNVKSVQVIPKKLGNHDWGDADILKVLLDAENATGGFNMSCLTPRSSITADIFGTKKCLHLDMHAQTMIQHKRAISRHSKAFDALSSSFQMFKGTVSISAEVLLGKSRTAHAILIKNLFESIRDNKETPVTAEEGRETVRILEMIQEKCAAAIKDWQGGSISNGNSHSQASCERFEQAACSMEQASL